MARVTAGTPDPDRELREAIYGVAASYLGIDKAEVRGDLPLREMGLDDIVMLVEALEVGWCLEFSNEALERVKTLDDLVREAEAAPRRLPPDATIQRWTLN
jgi:acyl carrier protein